jgi:uncharacterized protein with HEPN domain
MLQAANACGFVDGLGKDELPANTRTRQAVVVSLIIIGEAAAKIPDRHGE